MTRFLHFITLAALVVFFVFINLVAGLFLRQARIDLTAQNLYTLSDGTKQIIGALDAPLELKFYFSRSLATDYPLLRLYGQQVRDMLAEMSALSEGQLKITLIDPAPFSDAEDEALAQGLVAQPLAASTQTANDVLYFGLVGSNQRGGIESIPFFADERQEYLEYDLARLIQNLHKPQKPILGILSNLPLDTGVGGIAAALQGTSQPFLMYNELADRFAVEFITMDIAKIPARYDAVLLAHPRPLSVRQSYALDQYIMRGGRVIAFIDPQSEVSLTAGANGEPLKGATAQSNLAMLMAQWGVSMDATQIIADRARAQKVASGNDVRRLISDYIIWLALVSEDMNRKDIITAGIDRLHIGTAGHLTLTPRAGITHTPLVKSSGDAGLLPREFILTAPSPDALLQEFTPAPAPLTIAARIEGQIKSAFAAPPAEVLLGGQQKSGNQEVVSADDYLAQGEGAQILLFADSDFFDDRFWVSEQIYQGQRFGVPIADNAKFLLNAVDHMMGAGALISLRGRERIERPFTRLEDLRRAAQSRYRAQEDALIMRVEAAERELNMLERNNSANGETSIEDTQRASAAYRRELIAARKSLRRVQADLNRDIETLKTKILWMNIATMPLLLLGGAGVVSFMRHHKRKRTQKT